MFAISPSLLRLLFFFFFKSEQGLANYDLWAKSGPLPVFLNKVLLRHSCVHRLQLSRAASVLQWQFRCDREVPTKPKALPLWPFVSLRTRRSLQDGRGLIG